MLESDFPRGDGQAGFSSSGLRKLTNCFSPHSLKEPPLMLERVGTGNALIPGWKHMNLAIHFISLSTNISGVGRESFFFTSPFP